MTQAQPGQAEMSLAAAANCQATYLTAPHSTRRQINQGFFRKLCIGTGGAVERTELNEPFAALLDDGRTFTVTTGSESVAVPSQLARDEDMDTADAHDRTTSSNIFTTTLNNRE